MGIDSIEMVRSNKKEKKKQKRKEKKKGKGRKDFRCMCFYCQTTRLALYGLSIVCNFNHSCGAILQHQKIFANIRPKMRLIAMDGNAATKLLHAV
jgi:hypothetical protein